MNRASFMVLAVTIALAPLPFGSTDPPVVATWCILLGAALILVNPSGLRAPLLGLVACLAIVVGAGVFVLREQLAAHPWSSAAPHELWRATADLLGQPIEPSVSIARNQSWYSIGAPLLAVLALLLSFILCTDRARAHRLLGIVAWSGAAYGGYGILAFLANPNQVLWREKLGHQGYLTATFLNRNTAAVFFGTCACVWLLLACELIRTLNGAGAIAWATLPRRVLMRAPPRLVVQFLMLFLCIGAMFMTGSRAGTVLSVGAMIVAFWCYFHRDIGRSKATLIVLAIAVMLAFMVFSVLGTGVSNRFAIDGLGDQGRLETYRSTMRMIADHPWIGTGLGTFVWNFPAYRSPDASFVGIWDRAHNTWLELASDLGLPIAILVAAGWLLMFFVLFKGVLQRRRDHALPAAGLSCGLLAVTHSLVDFSLQIPGFTIVAFSLVGAGLAQSFRSISSDRTRRNGEERRAISRTNTVEVE